MSIALNRECKADIGIDMLKVVSNKYRHGHIALFKYVASERIQNVRNHRQKCKAVKMIHVYCSCFCCCN
jgi:hypothetical protein